MDQKTLTDSLTHNRSLIQEAVQITKNEDMKFREFRIAGRQAAVVFIDGMVDLTRLRHFILSPCMQLQKIPENTGIADYLSSQVLEIASLDKTDQLDMLLMRICQGDAAVLCEGMQGALIGEVKGYARRSVGQPVNETVVIGFQSGNRTEIKCPRRIYATRGLRTICVCRP